MLAVTVAGEARADKRPTEVERKMAHRFFEVAHGYYQQADYENAIKYFEKSYKLSKEPALLFNIGRCQEGLGRLDAAIKSYKRFLELTGRDRPMIKARISNLRRRIKRGHKSGSKNPGTLKQPSATGAGGDEPGQPKAGGTGAGSGSGTGGGTGTKVAQPSTPTNPSTPATPADPPQQDEGGARTWSFWTGWIAGGAGVAMIGVGIALGAVAASKASSVEGYFADGNRNWSEVKSIDEQGRAMETGQIAMLISGGVLLAAGAALLLFLPRESARTAQTASTSNRFQLSPVLGAGHYGFAGQLRF
ncbi:MAG: tetratricopeptide repeat protein [Myxococcales bacterium]|nr:tetratricopeptide repeat protein [Myxococcales bacterium]